MFHTPPPSPAPLLTQVQLIGLAASAIVAGLLLLLWGYKLARIVIVLAGAGTGFAVAGPLSERIGTRLDVTRGVMVFCLATVGLVTARFAWAAAAAAVVAAVVTGVVLTSLAPAALCGPEAAGGREVTDAGQWGWTYYDHVRSAVETHLGERAVLWSLAVGAAAGVIFLVVAIWPRPAEVILTVLIGAVALLGGAVLLAVRFKPEMWDRAVEKPWYVLSGLGALVLIGLIVQTRLSLRAARQRADTAQS